MEIVFNLLKGEQIRLKNHKAREEARRFVFDSIEFFYNAQRKQDGNGMLPLIDFEHQQKLTLKGRLPN